MNNSFKPRYKKFRIKFNKERGGVGPRLSSIKNHSTNGKND